MKLTWTVVFGCVMMAGLVVASEERNLKGRRPDDKGSKCPNKKQVVCVDGVTYQNKCLALLQEGKNADIKEGPCPGDTPDFDATGSRDITEADMKLFEDEGFKLTGRKKNHRKKPEKIELQGGPSDDNKVPPGLAKKVTRTTPEGLVYVAKNFKPKNGKDDSSSDVDDLPSFAPDFEDDGENDRDLAIIGADTRSKVSSSFVWPYWRLGELDWGFGEGGCSGTIVGANKVLTAAHCVYDAPNRRWQVPNYFAPGRYRSSSGATIEPWNRWPVSYATVYTAWTNTGSYDWGDVKYDVANLTMGTNWAGSIGTYMGTLQVIAAPYCNTIDSQTRLTGYPAEKPDGEMWTGGTCSAFSHSCGSNMMYH